MGSGTDAARVAGSGVHAQVIDDFKDQLLIALLLRLGKSVTVPIADVDATGGYVVSFTIENGAFNFLVTPKH